MSEEERLEIINWFCDNYFRMNIIPNNRIDYTLRVFDKTVPTTIWKIKKRIIEKEGLQGYLQEPIYRDFIAAILPGGRIHRHKDVNIGDFIHSRFNVFIRVPSKDMRTYYNGNIINSKEGHYTLCRSGLDYHWSTPTNENVPRISISFGFLIPKAILNNMYKFPLQRSITDNSTPSPLEVERLRLGVMGHLGSKWWWTDSRN